MVSRRITDISCNKEYFYTVLAYDNALKFTGFNENIQFTSTLPPGKYRNRNILWFNSPYSVNLKTKTGRIFLRHIDKHFPRHHKNCNLFNRNNIKIRYSWVPKLIGQTLAKPNILMELARKTLKSVITTTQHLLEIKIKKKAPYSRSTSGN